MSSGAPRSPFATALAAPVLAVLILAALLGACAHAPQGPGADPGALWKAFSERRAGAGGEVGILAAASLHYSGPDASHRMTLRLWGAPGAALRLDLNTGLGSTVAMLREEPGDWLGYFPSDNAAYTSRNPLFGQRVLGMDLPFTLRDLAGLVTGTYAGFAPDGYRAAAALPDGGVRYALEPGSAVTAMTLDAEGRPVVFAGRLRGRTWTMVLSGHAETGAAAPEKIDISLKPDVRAIVRVKRLERRPSPWPGAALDLPLPPGTTVTPLDEDGGPKRG
ncbi:LolA-like protein [Desulfocurvus sp. DL9XJH121]